MGVSERQLNRATLARQLLLQREPTSVVDAVHRIVAIQAQAPASPYVSLWNRVAGFDPADLDAAFAEGALHKATLMRITLHAVTAADHPVFRDGMRTTHRAAGLGDRRFTDTGLSIDDADRLVPHLVEFAAEPRTTNEIDRMLADRLGASPGPGLWRALRMIAPLVHAPTGGPWTFGTRPSYVASPTGSAPEDHGRCVQHLLRRYLEGFGPATVQDITQFTMLRRPEIAPALAAMADDLVTLEGPGGTVLYDVPEGLLPDEGTPAPPRLLAMWDSVLLAYADRSRMIPPECRPLVIRRNGDVLPTVLVDGHVAGVWRPVEDGIEVRAFEGWGDDAWEGLAREADGLGRLLADRDPNVYARYTRWLADLPAAEVRVLPR